MKRRGFKDKPRKNIYIKGREIVIKGEPLCNNSVKEIKKCIRNR